MVDGRDSAWRNRAPGPHRNTARQAMDGLRTEVCERQKQSNDPRNNQHNPQCANYWAPLTRKWHIPPHPAQPQHTNDWAPRPQKRHQREHRPQRPTERSDPTQHAKGRTGDCPGPHKGATTRRNVTQGGGSQGQPTQPPRRGRSWTAAETAACSPATGTFRWVPWGCWLVPESPGLGRPSWETPPNPRPGLSLTGDPPPPQTLLLQLSPKARSQPQSPPLPPAFPTASNCPPQPILQRAPTAL